MSDTQKIYCSGCDGTGLMGGWNRRDGFSCPKCKGGAIVTTGNIAENDSFNVLPWVAKAADRIMEDLPQVSRYQGELVTAIQETFISETTCQGILDNSVSDVLQASLSVVRIYSDMHPTWENDDGQVIDPSGAHELLGRLESLLRISEVVNE